MKAAKTLKGVHSVPLPRPLCPRCPGVCGPPSSPVPCVGYTEQCDLWCVGMLTYVLLCGWPPFSGKSGTQILKGKYEYISGMPPPLPPAPLPLPCPPPPSPPPPRCITPGGGFVCKE